MITLGIEGSANKIGVGIVKDGKVVANVRETYNAPTGEGFLPQEIAKHHRQQVHGLVRRALEEAELTASEITSVAYTRGPGIASALIVCAVVARTLAQLWNVPLLPVNHCVAHIEMGRSVTKSRNPVVLYVSGSNTQVISFSRGRYQIFGETIDIAVGNCLDRFARIVGVPNAPCPGYNIEKLAEEYASEYESWPPLLDLPYSVHGMDASFAAFLARVKDIVGGKPAKLRNGSVVSYTVPMLCYAMQECMFSMLVEITERAMAHVQADSVLVVGGVGSNVRLQNMLGKMAEERGASLCAMDESFCIDNGAMIAYTGQVAYAADKTACVEPAKADISQRFRTDQVEATWRDEEGTDIHQGE